MKWLRRKPAIPVLDLTTMGQEIKIVMWKGSSMVMRIHRVGYSNQGSTGQIDVTFSNSTDGRWIL